MNFIAWALLGMAGYSATTLFVKLATHDHRLPAMQVLAIAVLIVTITDWAIVLFSGAATPDAWKGLRGNLLWAVAAGVTLAIAVSSLFHALSLGPASVVVPIYGMFILGGALLGIIVLREPLTLQKGAGLILAAIGVVLVARG